MVLNFLASAQVHFINDQELNPRVYAEQFVDSDPSKALTPEELLRRARMIQSTELGKDPLLRNQMRKIFQEEGRISVEPTERGLVKINENHRYFVRIAVLLQPDINLMNHSELQISFQQKHPNHTGLASVPQYSSS